MKKILYLGNKLSKHGNTATSIETLGAFLEQEKYVVVYASEFQNKVVRLLDMVATTIKNRAVVAVVFIDVYSTSNFWYAFILSQLCRVLKLPYIAGLHGGNLPFRLQNNPKLCAAIFKNALVNVAPSEYLLEPFQNRYPANTIYIPNAINISKYNFLERLKIEPNLLWVRSFNSIYNPEMAIKVVAFLKIKYPTISLTMVGPDTNNSMSNCRKLAQNLGVEVTFLGKLENEKWIRLSENFSIFINTSNFDNTPITIMEAMALGLPVVSTNVGGIAYLLKNKKTALLVDKEDIEAMAKAIEVLLVEESLRITMTKLARKQVEKLDWQIVKNKWEIILSC